MVGADISATMAHLLLTTRRVGQGLTALFQTKEVGVNQVQVVTNRFRTISARIGTRHQVLFDGEVLETMPPLHD